jgi:hypothetical protein
MTALWSWSSKYTDESCEIFVRWLKSLWVVPWVVCSRLRYGGVSAAAPFRRSIGAIADYDRIGCLGCARAAVVEGPKGRVEFF